MRVEILSIWPGDDFQANVEISYQDDRFTIKTNRLYITNDKDPSTGVMTIYRGLLGGDIVDHIDFAQPVFAVSRRFN